MLSFTRTLLLLCSICPFFISAQEICDNLIDDDGDGWVDINDCECFENEDVNRGNVWHFGARSVLDFNAATLSVVVDGPLDSFEGSAAICDENGNLVLISDGGGRPPGNNQPEGSIWASDYSEIYGMSGEEGGGFSSAQSGLFCPKPGSSTNYYLFTMEEFEFDQGGSFPDQPNGRGLSYFEIDLSLNGGLGGVVVADQRLFVPAYEAIASVRKAGSENYYVVTYDGLLTTGREYWVFEATPDGVDTVGSYFFPHPTPTNLTNLKFSPTGNRLAGSLDVDELAIYDFDDATGEISNQVLLPATYSYGDFSPSGRYLYFSGSEPNSPTSGIFRVDLENLGDPDALQFLQAYPGFSTIAWQFQVAPDGNIYFRNGTDMLARIECPDEEDPEIEFEFLPVNQDPNSSFGGFNVGLPAFPANFFKRPQNLEPLEFFPVDTIQICDGDTVLLQANTNRCADFEWSTGVVGQSILVSEPGVYTVSATSDCGVAEQEIVVEETGSLDVTTDAPGQVCIGTNIDISPNSDNPNTIFTWTDLSGNILGEGTLNLTINNDITLILTASSGCGVVSEQIEIEALPNPVIELDLTEATCLGNDGTAILTSFVPGYTVFWYDIFGNIITGGPSVFSLEPGQYSVEVIVGPAALQCSITEEFEIFRTEDPEITLVGITDNFCVDGSEGSIEVEIEGGTPPYILSWTADGGSTTIGNTEFLQNLENGVYNLEVIDAANCDAIAQFEIQSLAPGAVFFEVETAICGNPNGAIDIFGPGFSSVLLNGIETSVADLQNLFPGEYNLGVLDENDCLVADTLLTVPDEIGFTLGPDTVLVIEEGQQIQYQLPIVGSNFVYTWGDSENISCLDCTNPIFSPTEETTYNIFVEEIATGCIDQLLVTVEVLPAQQVFIPNAFSPNDDGVNDWFEVYVSDDALQVLSLQVYDRWGELVFRGNGADARWDGRFRGQRMGTGVFVYILDVVYRDGRTETLSGDVTLLR